MKAYLADHPALAEQVEREIEQREALRARLAFKAQEPVPSRLRIANLIASRRRTPCAAVAAAIAWLAIGGVLGGRRCVVASLARQDERRMSPARPLPPTASM